MKLEPRSQEDFITAEKEGYNAGLVGKPETANPYKGKRKKGTSWKSTAWGYGHERGTQDRPLFLEIRARVDKLNDRFFYMRINAQLAAIAEEYGIETEPQTA